MLNKKYIKYFIYGYLNTYLSDHYYLYNPSKESYNQYRIRFVLRYLGFNEIKRDLTWISPLLSITEALYATFLVAIRSFLVLIRVVLIKHSAPERKLFFASFGLESFRIKELLDSIRPAEVNTIMIPFVKNNYHENDFDIISVISAGDICFSLLASLKTIWTLYRKYRFRDPLFRSYSSFEYYLTCCFVERVYLNNSFVFINTYDRWGFLFCNTYNSTFIQHGKLADKINFIRIGTPNTAYCLSYRQVRVLKKVLFSRDPETVRIMKSITFTMNELLIDNDKKNILVVCSNNFIEKEWQICSQLNNICNIYIKPHPADKDNPEYQRMAETYNCIIVPKEGYPKVDVVISYDSTLADQYEDVGVTVIRYDLLDTLDGINELI